MLDDKRAGFDFRSLGPRERYKLLIGTVVPRPIAWVTTVDAQGRVNAAPFSFFNVLSADPPILAVGIENHDDMAMKDTAANIRLTEQFTVNITDMKTVEAMNATAVAFPSGVDEIEAAGLTARPGVSVISPWIAEAPVALECKRYMTLAVGRSREIVLGEVLHLHLRADLVNERLHVDQAGLDAVGRMGGHGYSTTRELFDLMTPSLAQWTARMASE